MVKVITIMDDVYAELYKLKRAKGTSFSGILRYLLTEHKDEKNSVMDLAGSLNEDDLDHRNMEKIKRGVQAWQ